MDNSLRWRLWSAVALASDMLSPWLPDQVPIPAFTRRSIIAATAKQRTRHNSIHISLVHIRFFVLLIRA